ncbi:L,D-transpeptidase family protein [Sphingomonas montana]|uniref:L,D-transpeptidase family protein n=1 Tax=Sphingomonas montana TaxID=1843236 RepID=UPI0009FB1C4E|nr:L,D-transpeptidase family protein [Sphingomonas montana]
MAGGSGGFGGGRIAQLALGTAVLGSVAWMAGVSARTPPLIRTGWVTPKSPTDHVGSVRTVPAKPAVVPVAAPAVDEGMVIRRVLDVPRPFTHGDYVWDEAGVPAGPMIVTVDLAAQTLSVFRGGYEIGTAVVMYGADEKPTPLGIFPITQKDADHVSNLYGAPMPYMLRLTNDGVSIHGSDVEWGTVTHGCIGVPTAFAAKLFRAVKLGDRVIVTRGEMLQQGEAITAA